MAWLFKSDWVTNPRNPTNVDLDNIWKDQRTWGGNVDAGGYNLLNLSSLYTTGAMGIGTGSPAALINFSASPVLALFRFRRHAQLGHTESGRAGVRAHNFWDRCLY